MQRALIAAISGNDIEAVFQTLGYETACVRDGVAALRKCEGFAPEIVAADGILPVLDGFSLAKRIRKLDITRLPGIMVLHLPGMGRNLELPGCMALEKPVTRDKVEAAAAGLQVEKRSMGDGGRISRMLEELGVPEHPGRAYLADAVFLAHEDMSLLAKLTGELYPMVARRAGVSAQAVERAMRKAIETAWSRGNIEAQYEIFRNTIDAGRGKPTSGGMIAQLARMLRGEG